MKKPSNARAANRKLHKRPHVLDVTLTQSKERAKRARAAFRRVFLGLLLIGVVAGGYVGGREALRRFVWENPDYILRDIVFPTDGTLRRDDVLAHAGLVEGRNIFRIDLAAARRLIAELPQVESVTVERHLPNRITVSIVERTPIAWVMNRVQDDPTQSAKAYLIDARAIPMKPRTVLHQFVHLPKIVGYPVENLADGQRVTSYELVAALELIRMNEANPRWQIETIDVHSGYSLLVTDKRRIEILFHLDHLDQQRDRLHKLFTLLGSERQQQLKRVNLFGVRNTYVTFRPPPEPEPETPELMPVSNDARSSSRPAPAKGTKPLQAGKATPPPKTTPAPKKSISPPRKATPRPISEPRSTTPSFDRIKQPFNSNG